MGGRETAASVLGIDVGTTHCKAAVYGLDGRRFSFTSVPTPTRRDAAGNPYFDPEEIWETVAHLASGALARRTVAAVGVAGMAEAGLLVDRAGGHPCSEIIPWYDPRSTAQAIRIAEVESSRTGYQRSGLYPSFKYGIPKILWLRDHDPDVVSGTVWLSVPDYVVYRFTGCVGTDPTLAARTYAYDLRVGDWDHDWIERLGLSPAMFAPVRSSGVPVGGVTPGAAGKSHVAAGTPVAVSGHDHLCALLGVGIVDSGPVLDSMGTAESLIGVLDRFEVRSYESGLTVAPHVLPGRYCWLGGLPASGGSLEWLRGQLGDSELSYDEMQQLAAGVGTNPTGIIYFPYLAGSGAPWHDQRVRGAFVGLSAQHQRGHLVRAVLEGTAYETRSIQQAAEWLTGQIAPEVVTVGGGARNREWLQIKADVTRKRHLVPRDGEAAVRGAALTAAIGSGLLSVGDLSGPGAADVIEPDHARSREYALLHEHEYLRLQGPLRGGESARTTAPSLAHG
jgi:sugar (pentulose or hexulose) kinase